MKISSDLTFGLIFSVKHRNYGKQQKIDENRTANLQMTSNSAIMYKNIFFTKEMRTKCIVPFLLSDGFLATFPNSISHY